MKLSKLLLAGVAMLASVMLCQAQLIVVNTRTNTVRPIQLGATTLAAGVTTNILSYSNQPVKIFPGFGIGLSVTFANADASATSNVTLSLIHISEPTRLLSI